ncbi:MAG: hypothetical protein JXL81_14130 [Deltaproteobacteria bacterium]|nr:hypothetical protein [Deltaproteobacteria bacterium]
MTFQIKNKSNTVFNRMFAILAFVFILFLCIFSPVVGEVNAQNNDEKTADFLFQKPKNYLGIRAGIFDPKADSDLFDMVTEELTLKKSDFRAFNLGVDIGFSMNRRLDIVVSLDHSTETESSEFRDYVDEDGFAITQSTKFSQTPLTAGIRFLIIPRGREIGKYSWLPNPVVPYLSAGAGILWYEFKQHGDFVDFSTLDIFSATLDSSDETLAGYLGCGTEFNIFKGANLNLDFRYYLADDGLGGDFVGFDAIELGGYRLTAGIQWHF